MHVATNNDRGVLEKKVNILHDAAGPAANSMLGRVAHHHCRGVSLVVKFHHFTGTIPAGRFTFQIP